MLFVKIINSLWQLIVFTKRSILDHLQHYSIIFSPLRKGTSWEIIFSEDYLGTAWKVSKYRVISGLYFPVFGLEITPYLDTFHAVGIANKSEQLVCFCQNYWLQNRKFVTIAAYFGELFCTFLRNLNFPRLNLQKITLVNLTKQLGAVVQWYSEKWHKISRKTWETRTTFHKLAVLQAAVFWK